MIVMRGFRGGGEEVRIPRPTLKNHKDIGFLSNAGLDSLKSQTRIPCWVIVSPPAKRHFNGPLLGVF